MFKHALKPTIYAIVILLAFYILNVVGDKVYYYLADRRFRKSAQEQRETFNK